jgi:hypothetical protein
MNPHPRKLSAISAWLAVAALSAGAAAASPAGTVTQLSGPLFTQSAGGRIKVLSANSAVASGDTLVSGNDTFAEVTLADRGTVTLGPDTQLSIVAFSFDEAMPAEDRAELALVEGSVRIVAGAIAKRGSSRQKVRTPAGTIETAGATFVATYSKPDAETLASWAPVKLAALSTSGPLYLAQNTPPPAPKPGSLAPGLYVSVIDGAINLSNKGGTTNFSAGQFGYTANINKPPIVVPSNPGLVFTPPPAFSSSSTPGSTAGNKAAAVDCEVR